MRSEVVRDEVGELQYGRVGHREQEAAKWQRGHHGELGGRCGEELIRRADLKPLAVPAVRVMTPRFVFALARPAGTAPVRRTGRAIFCRCRRAANAQYLGDRNERGEYQRHWVGDTSGDHNITVSIVPTQTSIGVRLFTARPRFLLVRLIEGFGLSGGGAGGQVSSSSGPESPLAARQASPSARYDSSRASATARLDWSTRKY